MIKIKKIPKRPRLKKLIMNNKSYSTLMFICFFLSNFDINDKDNGYWIVIVYWLNP